MDVDEAVGQAPITLAQLARFIESIPNKPFAPVWATRDGSAVYVDRLRKNAYYITWLNERVVCEEYVQSQRHARYYDAEALIIFAEKAGLELDLSILLR